jgi:hypothetical protein
MIDPSMCSPRATQTMINKSKYYSARNTGWPAPPPATPLPSWVANQRLIAPAGCLDLEPGKAHEGRARKKPWHFHSTATLAHLNTPEQLELVVELLRLQTERPYIILVDTGSDAATIDRIEALRGDDLEIHYLRGHAWQHASEPIAAACDLALDLCRTEDLFFTHADCFVVARDLIARLSARCVARNPLVGYRLTERSNMPDWRWMVGHTCLMVHVPTARRIGARWNRQAAIAAGYLSSSNPFDTEYGFNHAFRHAGIGADILGIEDNYTRNLNDDFDHPRSFATAALYHWVGDADYRANIRGWMDAAMTEARARIARWKKPRGDLAATIAATQKGP